MTKWYCSWYTGLILGLCPANERRRYKVTPFLIGWAQTKNQPCWIQGIMAARRTARLFYSPKLVTVGLSILGMRWGMPRGMRRGMAVLPAKWLADPDKDWGNSSHAMHYGLMWSVGISTVFQKPMTVIANVCCWGCAKRLWNSLMSDELVTPLRHLNSLDSRKCG